MAHSGRLMEYVYRSLPDGSYLIVIPEAEGVRQGWSHAQSRAQPGSGVIRPATHLEKFHSDLGHEWSSWGGPGIQLRNGRIGDKDANVGHLGSTGNHGRRSASQRSPNCVVPGLNGQAEGNGTPFNES
jgi:hypothetical protein